jgi:hypothetical protein
MGKTKMLEVVRVQIEKISQCFQMTKTARESNLQLTIYLIFGGQKNASR